jgi:lysophospholipase L1-like esterase
VLTRVLAATLAALLTPILAAAQPAPPSPAAQAAAPADQTFDPLADRSPTTDPSITERPSVKPVTVKKIVLVGDSTTQVNSGWGGSFCAHHVSAFVACVNLGRGGRSTHSYRAEGSWDNALSEMRAPGYSTVYVLIQFGHNDQPGKPGRSTNPETEFPANLRRYVTEARAAGAVPVLLTPLTRRLFADGKLRDDLGLWAAKVRAVAGELQVPLVDLYARSQAAVQEMGPAEAARLAELPPPPEVLEAAKGGNVVPSSKLTKGEPTPVSSPPGPGGSFTQVFDYTHLGRAGADRFSAIVADALARAVPDLQKDILP